MFISGIYGLHKGVIQIILNSIEFEIKMHKQTEILLILIQKSVLHRGFASIFVCTIF